MTASARCRRARSCRGQTKSGSPASNCLLDGEAYAATSGWGGEGRADSLAIDSGLADLACDATGGLYFSEFTWDRIRRVSPDGRVSTFLYAEDLKPKSLAFGPEGALYFTQQAGTAEQGLRSVIRREMDGSLSTVAGGLAPNFDFAAQDGKFALAAQFSYGLSLAVSADGTVFLGESGSQGGGYGIYRIASELPGESASEILLPSEDGARAYYFTLTGRHLRTRDARTGVVLYNMNYDTKGCLTSIVDANGDSTRIERSGPGGPPLRIVAPYGQVTSLTMEGSYLKTVTNPAGEEYTLGYGNDGLLTTFEDPGQHTWNYTYGSEDGRLDSDRDAAGNTTVLVGNVSGITREVTNRTQEGRETKYVVQQKLDGTRRRFIHRSDGAVSSWVDSVAVAAPYGEVIVSAGVAGGTTVLRPARDPRFGWFAPVDSVLTTTLPSGLFSTITQSRAQAGTEWQESYAIRNASSTARFVTAFDTLLRKITTVSSLGRRTETQLDAAGRPTQITIGTHVTPIGLEYDARGKLKLVKQDGYGWRYLYDGAGRVESMWDTLGQTTTFHYDDAGRDTLRLLPEGVQVSFGYDSSGNVTSVRPPGRPAHEFSYNAVGLIETYTPPVVPGAVAPTTTYGYNGDGQLTSVTRPDGQVLTLAYESGTNRLSTLTHPRGVEQFTYTTAASGGLLQSITSTDSVTVAYGYDGPLLTSETWSGRVSGAVERKLDMAFRDSVVTLTVNGNSWPVAIHYDADGLLTGAGDLSIARRSDDGLIEGTQIAGSSVTSSQSYNSHGEIEDLRHAYGTNTLLQQEIIARDGLGRIVSLKETAFGTDSLYGYRYDAAGRLYAVTTDGDTTARYWYDANGNRTGFQGRTPADTATAEYDAQDRLLRYRNRRYTYTAAGELLRVVTNSDTTQYTYDVLGNLVRVGLASGDTIEYVVDGLGRRVGRRVDGVWTRRWLYGNELNVVAELDGAGDVTARYVYGTLEHVPDYVVKGDSTYRLVTDQLGSVRAVVNVANGTVAERIDYDAWGNVKLDTNPTFLSLGYAGGLRDTATELVRFGARDYDPGVGRWTAKDPSGIETGYLGSYVYVGNDPTRWIDESGCLRLPPNPQGLPPGWREDPTHRDPNGTRYRNPAYPDDPPLDYNWPHGDDPGTWEGTPHWHWDEGKCHLKPGDEVPDPPSPPHIPELPPWWGGPIPWEIPVPFIILPPWLLYGPVSPWDRHGTPHA